MGPLEATYELQPDATLEDLSKVIASSGFLQFTSTHSVLVGQAGNEKLVRLFSPHSGQPRSPQYLKAPDSLVRTLAAAGKLHFRFVFDIKG